MKPNEPIHFDAAQKSFADAHRIARKMAAAGTTKRRVHSWAEAMKAALQAGRAK
ncbi:hypothetical protein [Cupriavidus gilardii]|uniref:Uncharacterized protein n=1 Tax=Cupriavidus gilardii TaxID=82541 RepID=A0A849BEB0_9BURK|nr:hypothetical protein [Cupriavidus gilardii]NNH14291.1 hypothetical protein [Cupriavidus gilardii]